MPLVHCHCRGSWCSRHRPDLLAISDLSARSLPKPTHGAFDHKRDVESRRLNWWSLHQTGGMAVHQGQDGWSTANLASTPSVSVGAVASSSALVNRAIPRVAAR